MAGKQTRVGNLARGFAAALRDGKAHHRSHTVARAAQRSSVSAKPNPRGLTTPAAVTATRAGLFVLSRLSA